MKVYRIWCEWDMGMDWENTVFQTEESAMESIKEADWEGLVDGTLEEMLEEGYVNIEEINIK